MTLLAYVAILTLFCFSPQKKTVTHFIFILLITLTLSITLKFGPQEYLGLKRKGDIQISETERVDKIKDVKETWFEFSNIGRFGYIKDSISGFIKKPVFGNGLTSYHLNHYQYYPNGKLKRKPTTHNDYAQILYELGSVGSLLFIFIFLVVLKSLFKTYKHNKGILSTRIIQIGTLLFLLNFVNLYSGPLFWFVIGINLNVLGEDQAAD